ncbi:MAG: hypothetical protein E7021_01920 [Alphaproteobacteria bacterium]|nr:hypothetical protein [Alphaproteobacteria bacterium]
MKRFFCILIMSCLFCNIVNATDLTKQAQLCYAAMANDLTLLRQSLNQGASLKAGCNGQSIWSFALMSSDADVELVKELLKEGADPDEVIPGALSDMNPSVLSIMYTKNPEILEILLNHSKKSKNKGELSSLLLSALQPGEINPDIIDVLLKHGADLNYPSSDDFSLTPMEAALGSLDGIEFLLKKGVKIDEEELLKTAISLGDTEKLLWVLNRGFDVNKKIKDGWTPLTHACFISRDSRMVKLLIEKGADVNLINGNDESPLISALYNDNPVIEEIVDVLLENGADPHLANRRGNIPLIYARRNPRNNPVLVNNTQLYNKLK